MSGPPGMMAILFTDLVGSTEMLERLGEDAAEELRRTHFGLLRQAVGEAGGQEVKNLGDGLMVTFPSSLQAVACAVAMQRAVAGHNLEEPGRALEIRVGLHLGEPVADEDDFFGTSVVVAKRLCDRAEGNQILASVLVATVVGSRGGYRFRSLGRVALKGLAEPLAAVAVEWQAESPARPVGPAPVTPPTTRRRAPRGPRLVGRERELDVLEAELERAGAGEFSCVLVVGEPGVGKTRLASELLARHRNHILGLSARAYPLGTTASFGLWAEALERHLRGLAPTEVSRLCGGFLGDLAGLLRSVAAAYGSVPEEEVRLNLLEGLAVVLLHLAEETTTLVVLDDVHLADASSWEALQYLANNLAESRLLVVVAARPAELSEHELASRVLIGLDQEGFLTRLDLKPLDMEALGELTQAVVGQAPPPALVDWLGRRSRGNPLFTIGLLRALEEEGADLTSPQLHRVPEALADRVTQRLKGLDEPARAVIEVLSVLGRRVELGELADLGVLTSEALGCVLEQLVRSGLVSEDERGAELTYEISHPLIQEAIYESIGRARRRPLHRRIGRALLTAGRLGEAAPHYAASAEPGDAEAVNALCDALRQAEGRAAYRESLTILGSIVNILAGDDQRWLRVADAITWKAEWVIDHRADAHALLGIEALRAIDKALAHSADSSRRAAVKLRLGTFLSWGTGELDEAERAFLEAGGLFAAAGEQTQAMLAQLELAFLAGMKGRLDDWLEEARSVAEIAEAEGGRLALMHSVGRGIGFGAWYVGSFGEAEAAFHRALAIATEDGKAYFQTLCLGGLALTLAMAGRVHEALPLLAEAKAVNSEWRDSLLLEYQAMAHWLAGDFHSAVHSAEESAAWNPTGLSRRRGIGLAFAVLSAIETGQLAEARHHLARAEAAYGQRDWFFYRPYFAYAGAVLAWRAGDGPDALARLRRAASEIAATRATPFAALAFLDLTEMAAEADRADVAQEAAARLEELAAGLDCDLYRALAALAASWTALASGTPARAAGPARRAVDLLAPTGCRAFSSRAADALGRALSEGDRPGAVTALEQAVFLFEACGATSRRNRSLERLRQLGAPGRRAAGALSGPASLTRRERQVARLAAQGHTVRQIAERLYISERTVETHLSSVYAKLAVASKAELVGRAAELD